MLLLGLRPEVRGVARGEIRVPRGEYLGVSLLGAAIGRLGGEAFVRVGVGQAERDKVEVAYGEGIGGGHADVIVGAGARHRYREVRVEALVRRRVGAREVGAVAIGAHGEALDGDGRGAWHRGATLGVGTAREATLGRVRVVAPTTRSRRGWPLLAITATSRRTLAVVEAPAVLRIVVVLLLVVAVVTAAAGVAPAAAAARRAARMVVVHQQPVFHTERISELLIFQFIIGISVQTIRIFYLK